MRFRPSLSATWILIAYGALGQSGLFATEIVNHKSQLLWTRKMPGAISSLALAANGKAILIATAPESEIVGSSPHHLLSRYDSKGHLIWQQRMRFPVRDLSVSGDGALTVISNYEGQMVGIDRHGKTLWESEGMCRLQFLHQSKKILCYHDDDAAPRVAFDLFDYQGKKLFSYPIEKDILALKVSFDERNRVLALTEGQAVLLDSENQLVWKKTLEGEIVDIAVSGRENPKIAALHSKKGVNTITVFDGEGKVVRTFLPKFKATQVELSPTGDRIYYYGDSREGQWVGSFSLLTPALTWEWGEKMPLEFTSFITSYKNGLVGGFGLNKSKTRENHLIVFDEAGKISWDLLPKSDEGAYLYGYRVAIDANIKGNKSFVVVGMDDGHLNGFSVGN